MVPAEMTREARDALIVELRGQGLSLAAVGERVGLSGTRVGRILGAGSNSNGHGAVRAPSPPPKKEHRCATPGCGAVLKTDHYLYSAHTGDRYCWPGEGCDRWSPKKRKAMREANVAPKPEPIEEVPA